jgi:hypothetical protein
MKTLFGIVLASALTLPVAEAMADVGYDLQETVNGSPGFEGSLTVPGFISTYKMFSVMDFSVSNNPNNWTTVAFDPNEANSPSCTGPICDLVSLETSVSEDDFSYPVGTLSKTGQNNSPILGTDLSMELTVSQTGAVPEPSAWAMTLVGFVGLGYAAFRRSAKQRLGIA